MKCLECKEITSLHEVCENCGNRKDASHILEERDRLHDEREKLRGALLEMLETYAPKARLEYLDLHSAVRRSLDALGVGKMNDTPRTDAAAIGFARILIDHEKQTTTELVDANFARILERENKRLRSEFQQLVEFTQSCTGIDWFRGRDLLRELVEIK